MRRFLFVILFLLFVISSCANKKVEFTRLEYQISQVNNSVVEISVINPGKVSGYGTGFFVSNNRIVTALHVYEVAKQNIVTKASMLVAHKDDSKKSFDVPLWEVITDEENDLAILGFDPNVLTKQWQEFKIQPLTLSNRVPNIGEEIIISGYPDLGKSTITTKGIFSGVTKEDKLAFDAICLSGHSGSPVVSIQSQEVIGITVGSVTALIDKTTAYSRTNVALAIKTEKLQALLDASNTR